MRRREFIAGLGAAATWPLAARAQRQPVARVGVLNGPTEADPLGQAYMAALKEGLAKLRWVEGRNLQLELRWAGENPALMRTYAAELVKLAPDVFVTLGAPATRAAKEQTQTIPIVFVAVGDPSTNDIVKNIARPEANITGATNSYDTLRGKWLQLFKEAVPSIERVALIYNTRNSLPNVVPSIEEASRVLAIPTINLPYRDAVDIVHGIDEFAAQPNGGLMVLPPPPTAADRETILRLAVAHRLPTIYSDRAYVAEGGLMAYTSRSIDLFRRTSFFVDRILRGTKVSELPVEFPTKFELVINLKTAKAIGLTIRESFLLRADELIE